MHHYSERWPSISESRPYQEEKMLNPEGMLTLQEAERRARRGANELEEAINQVDKTPDKRDDERYAELTSLMMTFLATRYGIVPPDYARDEIERE